MHQHVFTYHGIKMCDICTAVCNKMLNRLVDEELRNISQSDSSHAFTRCEARQTLYVSASAYYILVCDVVRQAPKKKTLSYAL